MVVGSRRPVRVRREAVRLQAAQLFAEDVAPVEVATRIRVIRVPGNFTVHNITVLPALVKSQLRHVQ